MFKRSFKGKIIFPVVTVMIALVSVLSVYSSAKFRNYSVNTLTGEMKLTAESLKSHMEYLESQTINAAVASSSDARVAEAIKNQDREELLRLLSITVGMSGINYITLSDGDGMVILRTHEPTNFGDSVSNQRNVREALGGRMATFYESGTTIRVAIRTGAPV